VSDTQTKKNLVRYVKHKKRGQVIQYGYYDPSKQKIYQSVRHSNVQKWNVYDPKTQQVVVGAAGRVATLKKKGHVPTYQRYVDEQGKPTTKDVEGAKPRFEKTKTGMTRKESEQLMRTKRRQSQGYRIRVVDNKELSHQEYQRMLYEQRQNAPSILKTNRGNVQISAALRQKIEQENVFDQQTQQSTQPTQTRTGTVTSYTKPSKGATFGAITEIPSSQRQKALEALTPSERVELRRRTKDTTTFKPGYLAIESKPSGYSGFMAGVRQKLEVLSIRTKRPVFEETSAVLSTIDTPTKSAALAGKAGYAVGAGVVLTGLGVATSGVGPAVVIGGGGLLASTQVRGAQESLIQTKDLGRLQRAESIAQPATEVLVTTSASVIGSRAVITGVPAVKQKLFDAKVSRSAPRPTFSWERRFVSRIPIPHHFFFLFMDTP